MGTGAKQRLLAAWPLAGVLLVTLAVLAVGGDGGGVLGATLGILVFGLAYLVANTIRRHRGTFPVPPEKTEAEKIRAAARSHRVAALANLGLAVAFLGAALVGRGDYLPGRTWTTVLLLFAAFSVSRVPHLWATAKLIESGTTRGRAWLLSGLLNLALGAAAVALAVTNVLTGWVGGAGWTIALALAGAFWLLAAAADLHRARS